MNKGTNRSMELLQTEVRNSLEALKGGGVILYPTDTIWGLGCDATNPEAVGRISAIKGRESKVPFVVLIQDANLLGKYVKAVPDVAWDLVDYAENPLTIVYPGGVNVAPHVLGEGGTLAIRVTRHRFCQSLLHRLGRPLVSTSANASGEKSPVTFVDVPQSIRSQVDYVVNLPAERARTGRPSAIISLGLSGEIRFLRK